MFQTLCHSLVSEPSLQNDIGGAMSRRAILLVTVLVLAASGFTFAQIAPTPKKGPEMPATDDRQAAS